MYHKSFAPQLFESNSHGAHRVYTDGTPSSVIDIRLETKEGCRELYENIFLALYENRLMHVSVVL